MSNDGPAANGEAKRLKRLRILLMAGAACAALVLAGGAWFSGLLRTAKDTKPHVETEVSSQPVFVETPEMVTNLDAGPHRLSFVKMQCKIEVAHAAETPQLTAAMPRLVDLIQTYLRETRPEELRSDSGTYRLREALLLRASIAVPTVQVRDVLFEELIVQ